MKILLTGAAGFIGRHLTRGLRAAGYDEEIRTSDPRAPYVEMNLDALEDGYEAIFHLGAISDTTCEDFNALLETNVRLPLKLAAWAGDRRIPFIYASSASVYGNGDGPLNRYAESKAAVDEAMDGRGWGQWWGLRFFNVYGSGEAHKGAQASMVHQFINGRKTVFAPDSQRDFVHVSDVVKVMLWLWRTRPASGIYDVGTGQARSFTELIAALGLTDVEVVAMPESLKGKYQFHTEADLTKLRQAGYTEPFLPLEAGIARMA